MKYLLIIGMYLFLLSSCFIASGSYANSESYIVDIPYKDSEAIMKRLKETHPEYQSYFHPTYKPDSTLVKIISMVRQTKDGPVVEDEYIYKYKPQINYFINSKNDTIRYQAGDSIQVEDNNGFIDYYLPSIGYTVSCRILPLEDPEQTRVLLVYATSYHNDFGFKSINTSELTSEENKKIKKEFEKEILPKLGKWDHAVNAFLRFFGVN